MAMGFLFEFWCASSQARNFTLWTTAASLILGMGIPHWHLRNVHCLARESTEKLRRPERASAHFLRHRLQKIPHIQPTIQNRRATPLKFAQSEFLWQKT